jgi:hypothetical protein
MVSKRVVSCIFGLCVAFFVTTVVSVGYVWVKGKEVAHYKRELLAWKRTEAELLKGNSANAIFPHSDPRVGYVLNPTLKATGLWGPDNGPDYPINSLGLRGREIERKQPRVTRIVLVSDSWFFGMKLAESERLETHLRNLLLERFPKASYEVLTIAMPGWNVENEAAFLEDHIELIQPDVLVWSLGPNDTWTTYGVNPPGLISAKMSRSSDWLCPETSNESSMAPSWRTIEEWKRNLGLINDISRTYRVPVISLFAQEMKAYVSMMRRLANPTFPIFMTPDEFRKDKRWDISYRVDFHPTSWGNRLMAIDILGRLVKHELLPPTKFTDSEREIIAKGERASLDASDRELAQYMETGVAEWNPHRYPASYTHKTTDVRNLGIWLYDERAWLAWSVCPQGRLLMTKPGADRTVVITFDRIRNNDDGGNRLHCEARTQTGDKYEGVERAQDSTRRCLMAVPTASQRQLVEVTWRFNRFSCLGPEACFAARFVSLTSRREPVE